MKPTRLLATSVALLLSVASASAQILIGQTVGVSGATAATVKESMTGAALYIDAINAKGGLAGEKITILTLDDKFDTKLAAANARTLIEERKVLALFMSRGTPHTEGIIPILDQHGVPLIGPSTGAMTLHKPVRRHVFNVRATYQREAERAVAHLASQGITRIGVIHVDDSFGADGLVGTQKGLDAAKLKPVAVAKFDRTKPDFSAIVPLMVKSEAQAIVIIGSGTAVVDGIKAVKAASGGTQFVTLSNNASGGFIKLLGDQARGVIVSQVLPQTFTYPLVKEATQLAKARDISNLSPAMLEGFASAKVLVEALRRAGAKPTRERLQAALEGLDKYDLGGLEVSFSPTDHTGLDFADLSIISADGKFRR
ncbi:MAG: ABC transporter substrate-binding protein [Rhodoferax sp.]|nr:ABC transporter substrate-binding protein [Rhodoferax sp.]